MINLNTAFKRSRKSSARQPASNLRELWWIHKLNQTFLPHLVDTDDMRIEAAVQSITISVQLSRKTPYDPLLKKNTDQPAAALLS